MIYRIPQKKADGEHLTKSLNETLVSDRANVSHPYSDAIVKKPWGYEYLVFENEFVAIWILQIIRKRKTSMHCHPNKKTGLILTFLSVFLVGFFLKLGWDSAILAFAEIFNPKINEN